MYTLYKQAADGWQVLAYCDSPTEAAQAIDRDIEEMDECAEYRVEEGRRDEGYIGRAGQHGDIDGERAVQVSG